MSSFLQLLRIAFWLLPLQRWLAAAGIVLIVVSCFVRLPLNLPGSTLPAMFLGASLALITPILLGGLLWRSLSAPRAVTLLPHGRLKLLLGAIGIALVGSLLWMLCYALAFLDAPPKFRPGVSAYLFMFNGSLTFASLAGVSGFIASRSPFAMLCVLAAWLLPAHLLQLLGADPNSLPWEGVGGFVLLVLAWVAFGSWYLRARRIAPPGWLLPGQQTIFATTVPAALRPKSREQGIDGLLLGGSTVARIALQWLFAAFLLVVVQLLIAHFGRGSEPRIVVAMLLATLSINTLAIGSIAFAVARRSRALWLVAGLPRDALFRRCEGLVLRVCLAVGLAFGLLYALLWSTMAPHPPWHGSYLLASLAAPGLAAAWLGLAHLKGWALLDIAAGVAIFAGWYYGAMLPLFRHDLQEPWGILVGELTVIVLLRELARWRWRRVDWLRRPAER